MGEYLKLDSKRNALALVIIILFLTLTYFLTQSIILKGIIVGIYLISLGLVDLVLLPKLKQSQYYQERQFFPAPPRFSQIIIHIFSFIILIIGIWLIYIYIMQV